MYIEVGSFGRAKRLADMAPRFNPKPCEKGYCTVGHEDGISIFQPLLADTLFGKWTYCIMSIIWPHGSIAPHVDGNTANTDSTRYNLVLQSNDNCWSMHGGDWQQLKEGFIYQMDPSITHASINWGNEPRIHLVVDVKN